MARDGHNLHHIHHSDCGPRSLPHSLSLSLIQGRGQNLFFPHSVFEATISLCRSAGTAPGGPSMDGRTDDVLSYDELRGWAKHDGSSDRWPSGASGPLSLSLCALVEVVPAGPLASQFPEKRTNSSVFIREWIFVYSHDFVSTVPKLKISLSLATAINLGT